MPYIKQEPREALKPELEALKRKLFNLDGFNADGKAGILNYIITDLLDTCYGPLSNAKYKDYNEAIGLLECCKLEFYRRGVAPYEDLKERENGSVLDSNFPSSKRPNFSRQVPTEKGGTTEQLNVEFVPIGQDKVTVKQVLNYGKELQKPIQVTKCNLIFSIKVNLDTIVYIRANSARDAAVIFDSIDRYKDKPDACNMMFESHWEDLDKNLKNEFLTKEFKSTNIEDGLYIIMKNVTDE